MASKSTEKEIKKYSGLAKKTKDIANNKEKPNENKEEKVKTKEQVPEEPKITKEQVVSIFKSFGFKPNEKNNDIAYWTTRPRSEAPKLIEELKKRRDEINKKKEEEIESKETLPRLSDDEIAKLFDEYGFPAPDPEWARNTLPNDPQKIRSILDVQRKNADEMIKQKTTPPPEQMPPSKGTPVMPSGAGKGTPVMPSGAGASGMTPKTPAPMTGMGGPTGGPMEVLMDEEGVKKKPFFVGDHSIVRIVNPSNPQNSTTWLVDAKKKALRPFMSDRAFQNAFEDPMEAEKAVITISSKELGPGGVLEDFELLKGKDGVRDDGSMDKIEFSPAQIKNNYGKPIDPVEDMKAMQTLDSLFGLINKQ